MRYIKKLVILTGNGARGTLLLEKNGFGIWCELNIFDLRPDKDYKFVMISGDDIHVMNLSGANSQKINFELNDIDMKELHAAVVSDDVVMYGSNCAKKLSRNAVMESVRRFAKKTDETNVVSYSERDKSNDYIKDISPPEYDDFAIAESNYYPPQVSLGQQEAASTSNDSKADKAKTKIEAEHKFKPVAQNEKALKDKTSKPIRERNIKETETVSKKIMPHELEQKYLRLMGIAAVNETESAKEKEVVSGLDSGLQKVGYGAKTALNKQDHNITIAEKPEVIAMARRITLRDYRVEEPKKASGRKATFFERSSAQIEKLMNSFERFSAMEKMIPGSRFVKINYDNKRYYIVGVIGRDYICYGVPSMYAETPPELFGEYARWLPFNADRPHGEGFWMMYQDGISGKTLKS